RHVEFDQTGPPPAGVQLVWVEAPANPMLTLPDLEAAVAHPAPLVVDSTVATPVALRPLELGADFVLHSATKYLGGHDDVLLGVVVCKREEDAARLKEFRTRTGIVAAPDPCYLLLRGLKTLELRVRRQTETATELALRLDEHDAVANVRYPGFGGLLSFDVADAEKARRVENSLRVITNATSLGGVDSVLQPRARERNRRSPNAGSAGAARRSARREGRRGGRAAPCSQERSHGRRGEGVQPAGGEARGSHRRAHACGQRHRARGPDDRARAA